MTVRLNVGCGHKLLEGYINVDLVPSADVEADVRQLPFEDDSADELLAVHVLEHLYRWDALDALREWRRVLKPGGLIAIEVPDLMKVCQHVIAGNGERMGQWGLFGDPGYRDPLMCHRWCYTGEELVGLLREAGFTKVKRREPQFHKKARDMRIEARA